MATRAWSAWELTYSGDDSWLLFQKFWEKSLQSDHEGQEFGQGFVVAPTEALWVKKITVKLDYE